MEQKTNLIEAAPIVPEIDPGLRIREIYFEIRGAARVLDPEDKQRILKEYQKELMALGAVRESIRGITTPVTNKLGEEGIKDYYTTANTIKAMLKEIATDTRRLKAYKGKFWGAGVAFTDYFGPVTDQVVSAIFRQQYKARGGKLKWKKSKADAWRFYKAAGLTREYFNRVFTLPDEKALGGSNGHLRRTGAGAKDKAIPEIVRIVNQYKSVNKKNWPGYKWP